MDHSNHRAEATRTAVRGCIVCGDFLEANWGPLICPRCLGLRSPSERARGPDPICTRSFEHAVDPFAFISDGFEERYEFRDSEPFASGGQGDVFRVYDRRLRRVVALKRVTPSGPQADAARARFFAEAQITGQLQHPGFLPILDCGLDPLGRPFFTTYLLTGRTFQDLIRELRGVRRASDLAFRRALEVFETICRIVAYAHSRQVFHRDLKPNNILLGSFGEVYVIDMGAAFVGSHDSIEGDNTGLSEAIRTEVSDAATVDGASPYKTSQSGRPWTPLYSPPELVRGELVPDERTCDVFALGAMLYELVAGHPPYAASDGSIPEKKELVERILAGPPARLASTADWVPRDLVAVCQRASHRDPTRRYTAVDEIADDVRGVSRNPRRKSPRVGMGRSCGQVVHPPQSAGRARRCGGSNGNTVRRDRLVLQGSPRHRVATWLPPRRSNLVQERRMVAGAVEFGESGASRVLGPH
jgi:serine/threonine protein kinase